MPSESRVPRGKLSIGEAIGADLTVTGVLGEGGTGVVYAAFHALLRREVAVKMSHGYTSLCEDTRARLVREAKMCASVRDTHLPRIYALDTLEDGTPYIVMEKVSGLVLSHLLAARRLPTRVVCVIASELLSALAAIHKKGIVHRDVKPGNVMVDLEHEDGLVVRLLDLGVGKVVRAVDLEQAALTCQGELLGTPLYMAPEQVLGQPLDERADLYAAGVVLYEMLAGRTPFAATSLGEVFAAVLRDEITPLVSLRPDLPEGLLRVVHRATEKKPEQRFQSARDMRLALEEAAGELTEEFVSELPVYPAEQPSDHVDTLVFQPEESGQVRRRRRATLLSLARTVHAAEGKGRHVRAGYLPRPSALALARTLSR